MTTFDPPDRLAPFRKPLTLEHEPKAAEDQDSEEETPTIVSIDWTAFWNAEPPVTNWFIEPCVPAGRQVAIWSTPKLGKSLLALDIAAAKATGRSVLGNSPTDAAHVIYLDYEMTDADLRERLEDFGYGPSDDMSYLHYYLLPDLPPLDTEDGGLTLYRLVEKHGAVFVVIDTMARAVTGEENLSDTYRRFYQHTGRLLKQAGVSALRLDHGGKESNKGQRGSSGKADDVDAVFRLTGERRAFTLTRTHSRVPWVPATIALTRIEQPVLRHVLDPAALPEDTLEVVRKLDDLGVPIATTVDAAVEALRAAGGGKRKSVVSTAVKFRKKRREADSASQ